MKGKKDTALNRTAARKWITVRLTEREKVYLSQQATVAGLSTSEYIRRKIFGGRPLIVNEEIITCF